MKKFGWGLFPIGLLVSLMACQQSQVGQNLVTKGEDVDRHIGSADGESANQFHVVGRAKLDELVTKHEIYPIEQAELIKRLESLAESSRLQSLSSKLDRALPSRESTRESLIAGLSYSLLAKEHLFGGVVTRMTQKTDEMLGILKLADFKPVHVFPQLLKDDNDKFAVGLFGCTSACREEAPLIPVALLPLVGVNEKKKVLYVDLAVLAAGLNIVQIMDPLGLMTQLTTNKAEATTVDFSHQTLVFDVVADMTRFTNNEKVFVDSRWFLRQRGTPHKNFIARENVKGVGFFTTDRAAKPVIARHALFGNGDDKKIKYYIKHVPKQYKKAFSEALENWNDVFEKQVGKRVIEHEFLDVGHPLLDYIKAGDIRFNVIEWDLVNQAPYGGFGPSVADQKTGEILSANVLVQGPAIIEMYSTIFRATKKAESLRAAGQAHAAEAVLSQSKRELAAKFGRKQRTHFALKLSENAEFFIGAQAKELQDPLFAEDLFFDLIPGDLSFSEYMHGYFKEMIAHEVGHNLGLRHNFRGSLSGLVYDDEQQTEGYAAKGKVSSSVMEYLGIPYRHLNTISEYDRMAIAYGYAGKKPHRTDMFCTDDDVGNMMSRSGSAECSREDAGSDPFAFFESQVLKAIDLLLLPDSKQASPWQFADVQEKFQAAVEGLLLYASLADSELDQWSNFFQSPGRPDKKAPAVKNYVVGTLKRAFCDEAYYKRVLDNKQGEAVQAQTKLMVDFLQVQGFEGFVASALGLDADSKACVPRSEASVD